MKIAVIGSGIAGLSSAWCLARQHEVVLFERDDRVGGHTNTIEVPLPGGGVQPVDTGWIVYNGKNYPNLTALFAQLGVTTRPTGMSFAVSIGDGRYEWKGSDRIVTVFAQLSNLFRLSHLRMLIDLLRLNRRRGAVEAEELDPVELSVLRLSTWELIKRVDVPYRVVINEGIELAKVFGSTDGHKFVNGVLDKLAPNLREAEVKANKR